MTGGRRVAAWLSLAAAVGLAVLGQIYFFHRQEYVWDGVIFHLLAAVCFLLAWRLSRPPRERPASVSRPSRLGAWVQARPGPAVLLAVGLTLSLATTLLARDRLLNQPTGDVVLLWVVATAAVGLAALWPSSWPSLWLGDWVARLQAVRRETWLEAAVVAGVTLLALVLRVAALDRVPYTLGGDEAWHGLLARQVLSGELRNPFSMGYMSMPTFFYWPLSWSLWLVGDTMTGLRLPAALAGTLTVPVLYLFARDLWGRRTALLAALFLATYDYHIHYSRLGANNVWDALFVLLVLWALDRGLAWLAFGGAQAGSFGGAQARSFGGAQARSFSEAQAEGEQEGEKVPTYRSFLLAGLAMGLSVYFYTGARLLPVLVAVYVAFVWFQRRKQIRGLVLPLLLLVMAFLIVGGPMLGYAVAHPDEWNARINQVGILQSGWLEREPELTGKSTPQILAEQFLRSAGAFHVFPDRTVWYGAERPLLGLLAGALAVFGLAWALARWRERRHFLLLIWFWSVIITGGMLTESPPSSQRLVIAIPAVALLVAIGLERVVELAGRLLDIQPRWRYVALVLLIAVVAAGSVRYYFVDFSPERRYGSQNGETATMMGHYLRELDGDYRAYLFGAPRIYWKFGTMSFLAPGVPGDDVVEPLDAPPDFVDAGRPAVFLFLPERVGDLVWVQQAFPGGQVREFWDDRGHLRFTAYQVP